MALQDVRNRMLALLKRNDCTTTQANTFLSQGLSRIQRTLRVPSMERVTGISGSTSNTAQFQIPSDLLQMIDVVANGVPLEKLAYRQLLRRANFGLAMPLAFSDWDVDQPRYFARVGPTIWLYPALPAGQELIMTYYGEFTDLPLDTSENEATASFPDLMMYAGLAFAGDFYRHDSRDFWNAAYESLLQEVQDQATQLDEMSGSMAVQGAYGAEC